MNIEDDRRTENVPLRLSKAEVKLIDNARDELQLVSKQKISRADIIIAAIKHAKGKLI